MKLFTRARLATTAFLTPSGRVPTCLSSRPSDGEILDAYESIGDSCEFGALQQLSGINTPGLFKWAAVPLQRLAELFQNDLVGIDDPDHFALRAEARANGPAEYMLDHGLLQSPTHTFATIDEIDEARLLEREVRRHTILRRKFLEDARVSRRIFVYRSLAPRDLADVERVHASLLRLGPNRLLFIRPPGDGLTAGDVDLRSEGFAIAALDHLAVYEASTAIRSAMWPDVLRKAHALLRPC